MQRRTVLTEDVDVVQPTMNTALPSGGSEAGWEVGHATRRAAEGAAHQVGLAA